MINQSNNLSSIFFDASLNIITTDFVVYMGIKKGIEFGANRLIPYIHSLIEANANQAERLEEILHLPNIPNPVEEELDMEWEEEWGEEWDEEWDHDFLEQPPHEQLSITSRVRNFFSGMNF